MDNFAHRLAGEVPTVSSKKARPDDHSQKGEGENQGYEVGIHSTHHAPISCKEQAPLPRSTTTSVIDLILD